MHGRAVISLILLLWPILLATQNVTTRIPLSEIDALKGDNYIKARDFAALKLQPLRADVANLEAEERTAIAKKAANARWKKYRLET